MNTVENFVENVSKILVGSDDIEEAKALAEDFEFPVKRHNSYIRKVSKDMTWAIANTFDVKSFGTAEENFDSLMKFLGELETAGFIKGSEWAEIPAEHYLIGFGPFICFQLLNKDGMTASNTFKAIKLWEKSISPTFFE